MANGNGTHTLIMRLLDRYGPTTIMLIVMCAAVFKVASWVGPKVDTFLAAHIRQMEQLAEAEVRQTQILRDSMALMKEANVIGRRIEDSAKANGRVLKENQELIRNVLNGTKP